MTGVVKRTHATIFFSPLKRRETKKPSALPSAGPSAQIACTGFENITPSARKGTLSRRSHAPDASGLDACLVRRRDAGDQHGHSPDLRPLPEADQPGSRSRPPGLFAVHGDPQPRLGLVRAFRRRRERQVWRYSRRSRGHGILYCGAAFDGDGCQAEAMSFSRER